MICLSVPGDNPQAYGNMITSGPDKYFLCSMYQHEIISI